MGKMSSDMVMGSPDGGFAAEDAVGGQDVVEVLLEFLSLAQRRRAQRVRVARARQRRQFPLPRAENIVSSHQCGCLRFKSALHEKPRLNSFVLFIFNLVHFSLEKRPPSLEQHKTWQNGVGRSREQTGWGKKRK